VPAPPVPAAPDVEVIDCDYFARPAAAMVSPANSFGIMDGGLDLAIRDALGFQVQRRVQRMIVERHHGELPIGAAELVETGDARWPHLVVAPTMRVPENVAQTLNAYLAFRATLLACRRHAAPIDSLVCCGLATGIGGMDLQRCAVQMRMALRHVEGRRTSRRSSRSCPRALAMLDEDREAQPRGSARDAAMGIAIDRIDLRHRFG
jgi:O-acetyl-ADP-ribose deacetylase (regulator of RNase III)